MQKTVVSLLSSVFLLLTLSAVAVADSQQYKTFDKAAQAEVTPKMAIEMLKQGNARFVAGDSIQRDLLEQAKTTAAGQYPWAVVLSCLDSRSAPEIVFDQGVGDLFVGRVAGNVVDTTMLGSFEFAAKVAGAKVIVVMGHTDCGAVKGACDGVEMGNLTQLLDEIEPAIEAIATPAGEPRNSSNKAFVSKVIDMNAVMQANEILARSEVLRDMVAAGELLVVPAVHDLSTGKVTFIEG
jgi:carbonic anhydrase